MICKKCKTELPEDSLFCLKCGERINKTQICSSCGAEYPDGSEFCNKCGAKVKQDKTDVKTNREKKKTKKTFNLAGRTIEYADNVTCVAKLYSNFSEYIIKYKKDFGQFYHNNVKNFDDIIEKALPQVRTYEVQLYKDTRRLLMSYGLDFISEKRIREESDEYCCFEDIYNPFLENAESIETMENEIAYQRRMERATRSQWRGGGFGIRGAVKGAVKAGMMNAVTNAFRGIGDSITDAGDRRKIQEKKQAIYSDSNTLIHFRNGLYNAIRGLFLYSLNLLMEYKKIPGWTADTTDLNARLNNYIELFNEDNGEKENLINATIDCIAEYPFDVEYYTLLYKLKAVPYKTIKQIATYFGIKAEFDYNIDIIRSVRIKDVSDKPETTIQMVADKIALLEELKEYDCDIKVDQEISRLNGRLSNLRTKEEKEELTFGNIYRALEKLLETLNDSQSDIFIIDKEMRACHIDTVLQWAEKGNGYAEYLLNGYWSYCIKEGIKTKYSSSHVIWPPEAFDIMNSRLAGMRENARRGMTYSKYLCAYYDKWFSLVFKDRCDEQFRINAIETIKQCAADGCSSALNEVGYWYWLGEYSHVFQKKDVKLAFEYSAKSLEKFNPSSMVALESICRGEEFKNYYNPKLADVLQNAYQVLTTKSAEKEIIKNKREHEKSGGCYITTAICQWEGKDDDCYELTLFRRFRDTWLVAQPNGRELIEEYYKTAPIIVENIKTDPKREEVYLAIRNCYLLPCIKLIENGDNEECKNLYIKLVHDLKSRYYS